MECLFKEDEIVDGIPIKPMRVAEGVMKKIGFCEQRIVSHTNTIAALLLSLPIDFQKSGGGGHSFLNACMDSSGRQWTDLHQRIDELVCLGLAIDAVEYCVPRDMWGLLPGGMPYFCVK